MMTLCVTAALASSFLLSPSAPPAAQKAVTIKGFIDPKDARADHFTVTVQLDILPGWHTYEDVGEGSEVPTTFKLKLPEGAKAVGDWSRPTGTDGSEPGSKLYEGRVDFTQSVSIDPSAYGETIDVVISFQACNDELCSPPQKKTVGIVIPETTSEVFNAPIRITVKNSLLNAAAKKRFPSPAIFDVDGDGQAELVIGALMGSVGVYENLNQSGSGDPTWGPRNPLKGASGQPIRTSNW